jgi:hypothetical protein
MTALVELSTDERLIRAVLFGDDEAFAQLMRRHVGVKGECSPLLSRKWGIAMNSPCLPGGIH